MSPVDRIAQALESHGIVARPQPCAAVGTLERFQQLRESGAVRGELLRDADGSVQVLFAADTVLDLCQLNTHTRRGFEAVPRSELLRLCDRVGFAELPAVPGVADLPVMVDQELFARERLLMVAGGNELIELSAEEFARLCCSGCERVAFTVPLRRCTPSVDEEHDRQDIERSVSRLTRRGIEKTLQDTLRLPPLPDTARRIVQLANSGEPDIEALARAVELDPSLAAQVMGWALSPRYAAGRQVNSIRDAIFRVLGSELVLNLALGIALGRSLKLPRIERPGKLGYWQQAMYCAALTERLARETDVAGRPGAGTAYLAGLLHNFGYLVLGAVYGEHFLGACRHEDANRHVGSREVEQLLLGVTREQMAALLLQEWGLPADVCHAVRHYQDETPDTPLADLLCVATALLRERFLTDRTPLPAPRARIGALGLDPAKLSAVRDAALESAAHLDSMARQMGG